MKATETGFVNFLEGTKQFVIPIYQRTYSWTAKQCEQLWKDVVRVAQNDLIPGHFIGSVVYIAQGIYQVSAVPQLLVIDGQQRMTTLSLLLSVLTKSADDSGDGDSMRRRINNRFLFNVDEEGDDRYKLILNEADKETFLRLLDGKELPASASPRIVENFRFFEKKLRDSGLSPSVIYEGVRKLLVVDVSLDRTQDNPQLIFESMNSTGLDLTQADLIRNYVLMGLPPAEQTRLYKDYWRPMEQSFGQDYQVYFDRFMRDYLTIKSPSGTIPKLEEVYADFKNYMVASGFTVEELVADVYQYSKFFVKLALAGESDADLLRVIQDINTLRVEVAYPLLLEMYSDCEDGQLTRADLLEVLRLVESYVTRRAICGIPTNSLNKTFATFSRSLDKATYIESLRAAFLTKDSYRRFPTDDEFRREFAVKDVYNLRIRNYLLRKLENHDRKEYVDVEGYTIEHVLPQNENLSAEWQFELGPEWQKVQAKYLHTIGNLTLTGYNPELSDRPFKTKRDMAGGFRDSPIRLNRSLAQLDTWDEAEIQKRAATLAELASQIWIVPTLPADVLEKYQKGEEEPSTYSLDDYLLEGEMLDLFRALRQRVMNLDSSVKEEFKKQYIAYKTVTNFVDVVPQKRRLILSLNMKFDEVHDPKGLCRDMTDLGRWGNGDVQFGLATHGDLDYAMGLVRQAFEKQREDSGD